MNPLGPPTVDAKHRLSEQRPHHCDPLGCLMVLVHLVDAGHFMYAQGVGLTLHFYHMILSIINLPPPRAHADESDVQLSSTRQSVHRPILE